MMFREKPISKLYAFALAAVFALTLAGCGGGGGTTTAPPDDTPMPTPQETCEGAGGRWNADETCTSAADLEAERMAAQRSAISTAIGAATTAVNAVDDDSTDAEVTAADTALANARSAIAAADDLSDEEKAANTGTVNALATVLAGAKTARMAAMDAADEATAKANAELGKNLYDSLAGLDDGTDRVANGLFTLRAAEIVIAGPSSGGPGRYTGDEFPAGSGLTNPLKAGDSVAALGGWAGKDYANTDTTTKQVNEARVYNNQGPGKREAFADALPSTVEIATANAGGAAPAQVTDLTTAIKGYIVVATAGTFTADLDIGKVMADVFTHSGTQTHAIPGTANSFSTRGTYDGAPGEYRCVVGCSSTNDGKDAPSALGGTWFFKPDAGAMVHQPDAEYLFFGWWVNKNKDGEPMYADAFAGVVEPSAGDLDNGGDLTAITGSATYAGPAVGKFAMSNPLDGTGSGGHFTADAELKATFGTGATAGVTGTIDNFRLNDGSEDPGWSVSLARGALGSSGGTITAPTSDPTVWSINGNKAPASGSWSGTMYDEMPGDPPGGDGSNVPTTVTGTFYSEFSTIGRMVGAFGANKQ